MNAQEIKILADYEAVDETIKEDIYEAITWAREKLTNLEGSGHLFEIVSQGDGMVVCAFAKPSWSGDHCSRAMDTGSQAIVMAVCEYLNGA